MIQGPCVLGLQMFIWVLLGLGKLPDEPQY